MYWYSLFVIFFYTTVVLCNEVPKSTCDFPQFLQVIDPRRSFWSYQIRKQGFRQRPIQFKFVTNTLMVRNTAKRRTDIDYIYNQTCVQEFSGGKYMVAQSMTGKALQYRCIQYLQRSVNVIQMRKSMLASSPDVTLCDESALLLDPWPLVENRNIKNTYNKCPIIDGFDMDIVYDMESKTNVCPQQIIKGRMESECIYGEGLQFDWRSDSCIPPGVKGSRYSTLSTNCIGAWTDNQYRYIILYNIRRLLWCLRLPKVYDNNSTAILFKDVACDRNPQPKATNNYITIKMTRTAVTVPCIDAYTNCKSSAHLCDSDALFKANCPETCKVCDPTKLTEYPQNPFPSKYQGKWTLNTGTAHGKKTVEFQGDTFLIKGFTDFQSRTVDPNHNTAKGYTLFKAFKNGCRPRYSCLELSSESQSVLRYRLSQSSAWPQSKGEEICSSAQWKNDLPPLGDSLHSEHMKTLITESQSMIKPVDCQLSESYNGLLDKSDILTSCKVSLKKYDECWVKDRFILNITDGVCTPGLWEFNCLAEFSTDSTKYLITSSQKKNMVNYNCWVFPINDREKPISAVPSGDCNDETITRLSLISGNEAEITISKITTSIDYKDCPLLTTKGPHLTLHDITSIRPVPTMENQNITVDLMPTPLNQMTTAPVDQVAVKENKAANVMLGSASILSASLLYILF